MAFNLFDEAALDEAAAAGAARVGQEPGVVPVGFDFAPLVEVDVQGRFKRGFLLDVSSLDSADELS